MNLLLTWESRRGEVIPPVSHIGATLPQAVNRAAERDTTKIGVNPRSYGGKPVSAVLRGVNGHSRFGGVSALRAAPPARQQVVYIPAPGDRDDHGL
jgi:hypothetical protein